MTNSDVTGGPPAARDREQLLAETFVALADTLVDDYDVVDLLHQLVGACVNLLGVTAAGLLLDDQRGNLAVVASSNEETRLLEVLQLQSDAGPCLDCVRSGVQVTVDDLDVDQARWPVFASAAMSIGFRSVAAVPLRLRTETIGALNMFHSAPHPVAVNDRRLAQALADVATIGILQRRSSHRSAMMAEQLQHALNSRVVIEQAKGVLAERNGVDMDAAFTALRRYARNHNRKLSELAMDVVRGQVDPTAVQTGRRVT
jgi:GAF domain-containing protein